MKPGADADRVLLAHMRDCLIVHGYLGMDLGAIWLVVGHDLPELSEAVGRMAARLGPSS